MQELELGLNTVRCALILAGLCGGGNAVLVSWGLIYENPPEKYQWVGKTANKLSIVLVLPFMISICAAIAGTYSFATARVFFIIACSLVLLSVAAFIGYLVYIALDVFG